MKLHPLHNFVRESWRIESIFLPKAEYDALARFHEDWSTRTTIGVNDIEQAAHYFTHGKGKLRWVLGMDVKVGRYTPPKGGPQIHERLVALLENAKTAHPFIVHQEFEQLHPLMDGNGRVGRLLWLKIMVERKWSIRRGFLHEYYYQSLEHCHL